METWTAEQYQAYIAKRKQPGKKQKKPSNKAIGEMKLLLAIEAIEVQEEYLFHPSRKWRFDFAIPEKKIAIEYEGVMGGKSRHTTITGYSGDTEKYNEAAKLGWKVLRYTKLTYRELINDLKALL
ncbi:MAG TPA: hypothetical protein VG603_01435 [Chitinophagales bacterium]|nr:hypothetical protein [Chitinophagales bacterium]